MRSKEEAHDYRYFPDPDLLPLKLEQKWVEGIKSTLPELPDEKKARFIADYGLTPYDASVLVAERASAEYFEKVAKGRDGKLASNWVTGELFGVLNTLGKTIEESPVSAQGLGELLDLIKDGTVSNRLAKDVFEAMVESGKPAAQIVEEKGLRQVTDTGAIEKAIDDILKANADKVAEYKSGKDKLFGFFVGQVMKATGGKANPAILNELLKKKLSS
jgi:aspartyl-tRNA(Asn)/glutamyl-tRNA(Gln) amidotransferase subunit B